MKKRTFVAGAVLGGLVGGALVLLYAPQSGKKTRRRLQATGEHVWENAVDTSREWIKKGNETVSEVAELAKDTKDVWVSKAKEVFNK